MKKLLLSLSLIALSFIAFAQLPTIGIRGGVNFAKLQISAATSNISITTGSQTSFSVGAFVDFKFGDLSFQPALNYTGKGGKVTGSSGTFGSSTLYYLQVPLNLVYHVPVVVGNIYFGAGPYVAYGISGTDNANDGTTSQSKSVTFGGTGEYSKTDIGINGIIGIQFKSGFLIHLNYDLGLTNILNTNNPDNSNGIAKTRTFGTSVGFAF